MTLEEFAELAGVTIIDCDADKWGGAYGYKTKDAPNCSHCGAESPRAALASWLENSFGESAAKALVQLFDGPMYTIRSE